MRPSYTEQIDNDLLEQVIALATVVFPDFDTEKLRERVESKTAVSLFYFVQDRQMTAFKLGYEIDSQTYYSWLGCVEACSRGQGLATALMMDQHRWCKSRGYASIETKTLNLWKSMLILNIKSGFKIVDIDKSNSDRIKIVMHKRLV